MKGSSMSKSTSKFRVMMCVAVCGWGVGFSTATGRAEPPKGDPVLGGPGVQERNVPGAPGSFGKPGEMQRKASDRLPPGAIRRVLEDAIGSESPEATRATPDQIKKIEDMVHDHEQQVRAYMEAHKTEIDELRRSAGSMGEGRRRAKGPDGAPAPAAGAAEPSKEEQAKHEGNRQKMRDLMDAAPQQKDLITKIWAELTPAQREAADKELNKVRERLSQERQDQYVRQRVGKGKGRPPGPGAGEPGQRGPGGPEGARRGPGGEQFGPRGHGITPERRDRLLHLFEQLPPDMQDEVLRRMEDRMHDGPGGPEGDRPGPRRRPEGQGRDRRPGRGGEHRPAPPMDEVPMPPPERPD